MHHRLPAARFTAALALRAAVIWVGVRVMVALFGALAGIPLLPSGVRDVTVIALAVSALAAVELRRRKEPLFFANLGVAPESLIVLGSAIALLLELLLLAAKAVSS